LETVTLIPGSKLQRLILTFATEMASHPIIFGTAATISDCNSTCQNNKTSKFKQMWILQIFTRQCFFISDE